MRYTELVSFSVSLRQSYAQKETIFYTVKLRDEPKLIWNPAPTDSHTVLIPESAVDLLFPSSTCLAMTDTCSLHLLNGA